MGSKTSDLTVESWPIERVIPYARNPRKNAGAVAKVAASLKEFGFRQPIVVDPERVIVVGHTRLLAAQQIGMTSVPVHVATNLTPAQVKAYRLADNRTGEEAEWDSELLGLEFGDLRGLDFDLSLTGFNADEIAAIDIGGDGAGNESNGDVRAPRRSLSERFGVPPFSVLDTRQGYWQARKRAWLDLGIASELGRGDTPPGGGTEPNSIYRQRGGTSNAPGGSPRPAATLGKDGKTVRGDGSGRALVPVGSHKESHRFFGFAKEGPEDRGPRRASRKAADQHSNLNGASPLPTGATETGTANMASGTSIFDPVLCELAYRWFSPHGGTVLDPFAGGSVRGVVASKLGRQYVGVDLRAEQVEANRAQADALCTDPAPAWSIGDSRNIGALCEGVTADFVFSCPPYADLERYSDDPRDISTLAYADFLAAYREIIAASCGMLRAERFACFVVGDVRDAKGLYRNFVGDTVAAFRDAGLALYNEAILVTQLGSLPIRVGKMFTSARKLGKTHQNVLVFVKGDPRKATEACGDVEFGEPEETPDAELYGVEL